MLRTVWFAVILSLGLATPFATIWLPPVTAQEATPAAECPTTTEEENQAIVQRYYDVVASGDLDGFDEVLAPVVIQHAVDVADAQGVEEVKANIAPFLEAFPDLKSEIDQWFTIDDYVVARVTQSGTHEGDFLGIPATGKHAVWPLIGIWRIECGKIAEHWVEVDSVGRLQQLGVVPLFGAAASGATPTSEPAEAAMAASPPADCPATTEEENEALITRWYDEVWTQKNFDNFDDLIATNHRRHGLNRDTVGSEARRAAIEIQQTALPDVTVVPDFLLSEDDIVVARWTATGTHTGPWETIEPTGNTVTWTGNTIYRIECGKISEEWAQVDGLAFYEALGVLEWPPVPAGEGTPATS